ncbi:hypothetical protein F2Q69_00027243 [Brassica cretica]|uniref:Uncharacterized protein n=1 Tax=Brassica cretica TaxID=69181 RepID=A0A8S9RXH9_BRACR|nr:hypothetical protein F2Q69_00027243 [Brassica cretica]
MEKVVRVEDVVVDTVVQAVVDMREVVVEDVRMDTVEVRCGSHPESSSSLPLQRKSSILHIWRQGSVHGKSGEGGGRGRGYRSAGGCGYGRGCGGRREDGYSGGPLRQPSGVFVVAFVAEKKLYFTHMVLPFF